MAATKTTIKTKKATKPKEAWEGRDVQYPTVETTVLDGANGSGDLYDADCAKLVLGWTTEEEAGEEFGDEFTLKDFLGNKVRCTNNISNRPWYSSNTAALKQEMLNGRWAFNGEPIIVSRTGLVLNGQHQSIALVLAQQEIEDDPKHWKKQWPDGKIAIPKLVVYGVSDDRKVVDTLDTGKPRSLSDVLFRGPLFAQLKPSERKIAARIAEFAIRTVWERTGAYAAGEAYGTRRTHGEMLEFLDRHPSLVKAVMHCYEEDDNGRLRSVITAGTMSGLMYLMAAGGSDLEAYQKNRRESKLNLDGWQKASEYVTLLAGDNPDVRPVRDAIAAVMDAETGEGRASSKQRGNAVISGWLAFSTHGNVTNVHVETDPEEAWKCGGIDLGWRADAEADETDAGETPTEGEDDAPEGSEEEQEAAGTEDGEEVPAEEAVAKNKTKAGPKPEAAKKPKKKKPEVDADEPAEDAAE